MVRNISIEKKCCSTESRRILVPNLIWSFGDSKQTHLEIAKNQHVLKGKWDHTKDDHQKQANKQFPFISSCDMTGANKSRHMH